jgi:alpha-glucosidase
LGTERIIPTLSPQINALPSLTPTIYDDSAPDPQKCPGYKASNVAENDHGFTADLTIAGANCQAFGTDIADLTLEVSYQAKERLNVRIYPKYIAPKNSTQYILPANLVEQPEWDGKTSAGCSDLKFDWSNDPTFQFKVLRSSTGEELFSTYGHVIVYEDQFLELVTNMVEVSFSARFVSVCLIVCTGLQCVWPRREHSQLSPRNKLYSDVLRCGCR